LVVTRPERQKIAEATRAQMQARAQEKDVTLPQHRGPRITRTHPDDAVLSTVQTEMGATCILAVETCPKVERCNHRLIQIKPLPTSPLHPCKGVSVSVTGKLRID